MLRVQVDSVWLDFLDAKQNELFQKEHGSTSSFVRRILVGGFAGEPGKTRA